MLNFSHVRILTKEELLDKAFEPFLCSLDLGAKIDFEDLQREIRAC